MKEEIIKKMISFASWAIHSGKCASNPSIKDIEKWESEKSYQDQVADKIKKK